MSNLLRPAGDYVAGDRRKNEKAGDGDDPGSLGRQLVRLHAVARSYADRSRVSTARGIGLDAVAFPF
jgi:hypothetical protein